MDEVTADSAIMHPKEKIIALKCQPFLSMLSHVWLAVSEQKMLTLLRVAAGRQLQVFNLGTKSKLGSHLMNEDVTFWTWVSDDMLGLVTEREVFHWKVMEGQAAPTKVEISLPSFRKRP